MGPVGARLREVGCHWMVPWRAWGKRLVRWFLWEEWEAGAGLYSSSGLPAIAPPEGMGCRLQGRGRPSPLYAVSRNRTTELQVGEGKSGSGWLAGEKGLPHRQGSQGNQTRLLFMHGILGAVPAGEAYWARRGTET